LNALYQKEYLTSLFERSSESKIGWGDHVSTGAGYKTSRAKKWTILNYKTVIIIKTRQQLTYTKKTNTTAIM
jgi:hypothetical protein